MRVVILAVLVGLAAGASVRNIDPLLDYHGRIGIPLAAQIKADEEAYFAGKSDQDVGADLWSDRIVGGAVAPANAHPYLAGLVVYMVGTTGVSVCGASLLTANRLVTAAHCWWSNAHLAYMLEVVLGSQWLFTGGTRVQTSHVVMHTQYNPSLLLNDIAMIYLPTNVAFSQSVQPIALPPTTQLGHDYAGWWAVAAGYGKTSDQQTGVSTTTVVSQVTVSVITNVQCQATFGGWVTAGNVCTNGAGGIGICGGDSGGPLVVNNGGQNILIGVSSFVAGLGCQLGFPSAFARVTSFYSFILQHM